MNIYNIYRSFYKDYHFKIKKARYLALKNNIWEKLHKISCF